MKYSARFFLSITLYFSAFSGFAANASDLATIKKEINSGRNLLHTAEHQTGMNQLNAAVADMEFLRKQNPNDPATVFQIAMAYFYMENDEQALKSFGQMALLSPADSRPWFFQGLILRYANDFASAEKAFLKASELAPKDEDNWYELGVLYYNAEKDTKAIAAFKKAISINPKHEQACYKLALNYMDADQAAKAYPLLLDSVKTQPDNVNVHYNFGQLCQNMGKSEEALTAFRKVVELDPNEWRAIEKLVQLNQALGNLKERDAARQLVFDLRTSGNVKALNEEPLYIRDQFTCEGQLVMTCEYFEMKGERAIRYSFVITNEMGENGKYRITLGSYDTTNDFAERQGKNKLGERTFHLDGYYPDGAHRTFSFFQGEPDYETVKGLVVKILEGKMHAISSTTPTPQKESTD